MSRQMGGPPGVSSPVRLEKSEEDSGPGGSTCSSGKATGRFQ